MERNEEFKEILNFKETFKLLNVDHRKFEYRLKNHHFSRAPKKLLEAFWFFKKNQKEEVFQRVQEIKFDQPFYEGMRRYILGMVQNHFGLFRYAIENLEKSVEILSQLEEEEFLVYPMTVLILAYGNTKDIKNMARVVDSMKGLSTRGEFSQLLRIHAEVLYLVQAGFDEKAEKMLSSTFEKKNQYLKMFEPSFLIIQFNLAFKRNAYDSCEEILDNYKNSNGFIVKINYTYMKSLLDHLAFGKALYVYESDFKDYPELHHQLEVVKALSRSDTDRAKKFWELLQRHNPKVYLADYTFNSEKCLFSEALSLYRTNAFPKAFEESYINKLSRPLDKLHHIFTNATLPQSKAELIRLIWGEEYNETSMGRLRKLVHDYNKKYKAQIISHHDTYKLKKSA